jgi:hypothetical protein
MLHNALHDSDASGMTLYVSLCVRQSVDREPTRSKLFCYCCAVVNICTNWPNACQQNAEILSVVIKWETFLLNCSYNVILDRVQQLFLAVKANYSLLFCKRNFTIPCGMRVGPKVSGLTYKSCAKWKMLWGIYSAIYGEVNVSVSVCVEIKWDNIEK